MIIRSATVVDLTSLVDFVLAEAHEAEGRELDRVTVAAAVGAALADPALARYWVAEDASVPIAAIAIVLEWSDWLNAAYWWVQLAYVTPDHRRRGVIRALVDHVRTVASTEGAPELRLYVHPSNTRAIRAYERLGFTLSPYVMMTLR